jgi:hypothetical protein
MRIPGPKKCVQKCHFFVVGPRFIRLRQEASAVAKALAGKDGATRLPKGAEFERRNLQVADFQMVPMNGTQDFVAFRSLLTVAPGWRRRRRNASVRTLPHDCALADLALLRQSDLILCRRAETHFSFRQSASAKTTQTMG